MQLVCNRNHSSSKIPPDFAATMFEFIAGELNNHSMISLTFLGKHTLKSLSIL